VSVNIDAFIPKKIKQRDLISAISKSYNLLFTPDPDNETNIIIKTRDKYYNDGLEWDWTEKLDESQPNSITFLNNDVKQRQEYKYKDDKDSLNAAYQAEFVETYGQTTLILDNEYTVGTDKREIMYSPTPSVGSGINIPLPSINGVNPDCNIRVLLHNGVGTVSQYPFYDDLLPNASAVAQVTEYNNTSMFDNDLIPNFSICYDSPNVLFHSFQQGQTTNYLYNLHHQQELTTINEGKRLTGYFNLTEADFQKLSKTLDWKIFIKDNGWFFVSKIYGYNSGKRTITKVDLITADEKLRLKYKRPFRPFGGTTVSFSGVVNKHFDTVGSDTNIRLGNDILINGKYNFAVGENIKIQGDQNKVLSSNVMVMGNYNDIGTGLGGTKVIGDSNTPTVPNSTGFENFANTDLTFTGTRVHDLDGNILGLIEGNTTFQNSPGIINPVVSVIGEDDTALYLYANDGSKFGLDVGNGLVRIAALPIYANEAAAIIGGLITGTLYKTPTGEVRIKL
jgi:hypothetical protein